MPRLYLLAAILFVPVAIYVLKQLGLEESELRRTAGFLFVFAIGLGVFFAVVGWLFLRYFEFQEKKYFKFLENQLAKRNARIQENQIVFSHKSLEIAVSQSSVFLGEGTADVYVLKASPFTRKDFQLKIIKAEWLLKMGYSKAQAVEIGIPHMDSRFLIFTNDKNLTRKFLSPEIQEKFFNIRSKLHQFQLENGVMEISIYVNWLTMNDALCDQYIETGLSFVESIPQ